MTHNNLSKHLQIEFFSTIPLYTSISSFHVLFLKNSTYQNAHQELNTNYEGILPQPDILFEDGTLMTTLKDDNKLNTEIHKQIIDNLIALVAALSNDPTSIKPLINNALIRIVFDNQQLH